MISVWMLGGALALGLGVLGFRVLGFKGLLQGLGLGVFRA